MATSDTLKRTIQIEIATADKTDEQSRMFEATGQHVTFESHQGGVFTDVYHCSAKPDTSGVVAGRGRGYVSFQIENASDPQAAELVEELRELHREVIITYRERKKETNGKWASQKTMVLWGYIASARVGEEGPGSIGIEVHCKSEIMQNDSLGTRQRSIDLISGAVNGQRRPLSIPAYAGADGDNFEEDLEFA